MVCCCCCVLLYLLRAANPRLPRTTHTQWFGGRRTKKREEEEEKEANPPGQQGFFYVVNHGITDAQVRRQYALGRALFALPLDEKLRYACDTARGDFRGYKPRTPPTGDNAGLVARDNDERYNVPKDTPEHEGVPHPPLLRAHRAEVEAFSRQVHDALLLPLLRLFARVLELGDDEALARRHRYEAEGLAYLRYMQYFPRPADEDARGGNVWAKGHTDYNTLTFLFHQPVAGLQVQTGDPGSPWKYVGSPRDAVIVNIADALEFLSGGYLKSTVHRVVRPPADQADRPRLGLIYFARPEANTLLQPVDSPLLRRLGLGERSEQERFARPVTAEGRELLPSGVPNQSPPRWSSLLTPKHPPEWARARIAKDHRFRVGIVDKEETEIIAGVKQKYYH